MHRLAWRHIVMSVTEETAVAGDAACGIWRMRVPENREQECASEISGLRGWIRSWLQQERRKMPDTPSTLSAPTASASITASIMSTNNRWRRAGVIIALTALFGAATAVPAIARSEYVARNAYDGDWSVLIQTRRGACDPAIRYGVEITNGVVTSSNSGPATVQGRVTPRGGVSVSVRSGPQWANGSGRLARTYGGGIWQGQGTSGACEGTWQAQRRSYGAAANATGAPRYYNYYDRRQ
jgi:hypothetical protein